MADKTPDELKITTQDLLMSIRGGYPEKCDFCEQPLRERSLSRAEEAGAWACSECEARWRLANDE